MFDAQLLQSKGNGAEVSVFSPWFPRGGDYVLVSADLVNGNLAAMIASFSVGLFHKNAEDTGDGTQVTGGLITSTTVGVSTKQYGPLKELVRYKFTVDGSGAGDLRWALFRMLTPVWFDAVAV